jgi:hypothetical protein
LKQVISAVMRPTTIAPIRIGIATWPRPVATHDQAAVVMRIAVRIIALTAVPCTVIVAERASDQSIVPAWTCDSRARKAGLLDFI